jgi:O-antigen ligase
MGPEAKVGSGGGAARLLSPVIAGGVALAVVLRIFQGGAREELAAPSLNLIADAFLLATIVLAALRAALEGAIELPPARLLAPLAGLVLAAWMSLARADNLPAGLRRAELFSAAALLAILLFPLASRRGAAAGLLAVFLAAAGVIAALAWKERLHDLAATRAAYESAPEIAEIAPELRADFESRLFTDQVSGPFLLPNGLGAFLAMAALAGAAVAAAALAARGRRAFSGALAAGLVAALALGGMAFTHEKGCWVGLAGGAAVAAAVARGRRRILLGGAALAAAGLLAVALVPTERLERLPGGISLAVRKEYWQAALRIAGERPLGGVGAGNFAAHYEAAKSARAEETIYAHEDYLEALAEMGPLGAASLLAFWAAALARARAPGAAEPGPASGAPWIAGGAAGILLLRGIGHTYGQGAVVLAAAAAFVLLALAIAPWP